MDGSYVRGHIDEEFTNYGQHYRFAYIPINEFWIDKEVWIDSDILEAERGFVLLHELHERKRMSKGWAYNKAHAESSRLEYRCRHQPDELHEKLVDEGWA